MDIRKEKMRQKRKSYSDEEWVRDLRPDIERRAEMLRKEMERREEALLHAPEGSIRVIRYGNTYQYFQRTDPKDAHGIYLKRKDKRLAAALAQKGYAAKFVAEAKKQLKILDEYLRKVEEDSIGKIFDNLHDGKKLLINPVFESRDDYARKWEAVTYLPGFFDDSLQKHYTAKGERVRSKVEINIANILKMYGVPYRYEYPLLLGDREIRPDFLCLNARTRKEYIWEHFGMMDSEIYALKNVDKINKYMEMGYYPGESLIMTFESTAQTLSTFLIKAIIEKYLL